MKFKVELKPFHVTTHFYFGDPKDYVKDSGAEGVKDSWYGACCECFVWIRNKKNIPALVHETSHLVDNIFEAQGLKGEETRAYLQEYFVAEVLKKLKIKI